MAPLANKETLMRKGWQTASHVALIALLLLSTACSRSLQGNAGSRSFDSADSPFDPATSAGPIPSLLDSRPVDRITAESLARQQQMIAEPIIALPNSHNQSIGSLGASLGASRGYLEERRRAEGSAAAAAAGLQDVFFPFDSSTISDEAIQALLRDTAWLRAHPYETLVIEGHCDGRGTLDYNLVLGEKRAKTVRTFFMAQQINPTRLTIVSYGKERPFCVGAEESCYQQNRRGHLILHLKPSR